MSLDVITARRNIVLNALADAQLQTLLPLLHERPLPLGDVLYRAGEAVNGVYFPLAGVVSILTEVDGHLVEVATVGRDAVVGLPVYLGTDTPTETATVQVAGTAFGMTTAAFRDAIDRLDAPLHTVMRRYAAVMFTQLARNAACNRVHQLRQRAARWLLTTADRTGDAPFQLTQEFLAQMLAVRRSSVNEIAQTFADEGAINYTRGQVTILERQHLHTAACSCYDVLRDATQRAFPTPAPEQTP